MAVDPNGYITQPLRHMLQPAFSGIVAVAVERLVGCFAEKIHSLYLYGSVAAGRATFGKSDLDITIIFHRPPDQMTTIQLTKLEHQLVADYPAIAKIDFDCGTRAQALDPEKSLSWGYGLKHHCLCLYGEDLSLHFSAFMPCKAIAVAVNGDFLSMLDKLLPCLPAVDEANNISQRLRTAVRKLIRSTNMLRDEQDKGWPDTLEEHSIVFKSNDPTYASEMDYLLTISDTPRGDMAEHKKRIIQFARWLAGEVKRQAAAENLSTNVRKTRTVQPSSERPLAQHRRH